MKVNHLSQYRNIFLLLWKYGNADWVKNAGAEDLLIESDAAEDDSDAAPEQFVADLEAMGPTFIKFGQLLSGRPDLLPQPYLEALDKLQDNVEPFSFAEVEKIVEEELGVRISKAFESFEAIPLASASLGQVHWAVLRDGREVAVKIQRPGIRQKIKEDIEALESAADWVEKHTEFGRRFEPGKLMHHFHKVLVQELDYQLEAHHLEKLGNNLKDFRRIVVPSPVWDYTTGRVLTMDFIKGKKITKITPLRKMEIEGHALAEELFQAYLRQLVNDGFMHADPHPGNIHLTADNRLALFDLGMIANISPEYQENYLKLLLAIGDGRSNDAADVILSISRHREDCNEKAFREVLSDLVMENMDRTARELKTGRLMLNIIRAASLHGFLLPVELSMIGKTFLNLDQIAATLAPDFNPNEAVRRHSMELMNRHIWKSLTQNHMFSTLLEGKKLLETLPEKLNRIITTVADNDMRLKVDSIDEKYLMAGFQKIANRITLGLILASLVVGAALMMRIPSSFTILGYPGIAMVCFLLAATGAVSLAYQIVFRDESTGKKNK